MALAVAAEFAGRIVEATFASHFALAFFWQAAQNDSGCKPCLWPQSRGEARLAVTSYGLGVWYVVELVGIEPATGLPVTAMAVSPWIAPQRNQSQQFQVSTLGTVGLSFSVT